MPLLAPDGGAEQGVMDKIGAAPYAQTMTQTPPSKDGAKNAPRDPAKGERIAKFLSRAGIASRREAERMIEEGRVSVNGTLLDTPAHLVTERDLIVVDDKPVGPPEQARLWLYHKPLGLVTTAKDEKGRETVFDTLPEDLPRVMSVGRLDLNSEGLLLLTNDGELKRKLELPSTGWVRKYRVRVKGTPSEDTLSPIRRGMVIDGERFQPMSISLDRQQGANAWLTIGLREGKNREIRRAMEAVGLVVNRLLRISYGPFRLGELKPGEVEEIKPRVLRDQLGLEAPEDPQPAAKPGKPGRRPGGKPGGKPGAKPGGKFGKPGAKPAGRFGGKSTPDLGDDMDARPATHGWKSGAKPGARSAGKPGGKPGAKPAGKPGGKPGGKPAGKPGAKPAGRASSKPGGKPARGGPKR